MTKFGRFKVVCGPMFSEKSTTLRREILRALRARRSVMVFVPQMDKRSAGTIRTHSGLTLEGATVPYVVESSEGIVREFPIVHKPSLVVIEEAQFFDPKLPVVVEMLLSLGVDVVAGGLDMTSEGEPFGCMGALLAMCDEPVKLTAVCQCGADATHTYYTGGSKTDTVVVGGAESYEPRCRACWSAPRSV